MLHKTFVCIKMPWEIRQTGWEESKARQDQDKEEKEQKEKEKDSNNT